ncbi:MAG TPA: glycosyltransferase family 4 protein [Pirellulaceae bacterium]
MRILILHQNFVDHQHPGGTRHLDIAACLVQRGHEVTIVASNVDYLTGRSIPRQEAEVYQGVRVLRAYALPSVQRGLVWRTLSYLSFVPSSAWTAWRAGPFDLVLGTTPPIFQLPSAWLVARLRRIPFVLEVLDLWPDFAIGMGVLKNRWLIAAARFVEWFFYRAADHLVVNSPAYGDYLVEGGISRDHVTFIPMGVDLALFDPEHDGRETRARFQLGNRFVATYAGSLGMANDLDTILDSAALLRDEPDVHFLLVGGGKERPRLESLARDRRLDNVTFAGTVPKEQVGEVLAASNACIATLRDIPEFRMPFPNKVLDYMAAGRPVLLAIDGVIRNVVETAGAGIFVPPGDAAALAAAIRRLQADPQAAQAMGRAGHEHVKQFYPIGVQAERFAEVFARVSHQARS